MRCFAFAPSACLVLIAPALWAEEPVRIRASFENRAHHEARVSVTFPPVATNPLEIRMSRSSPGRYALHEFAKNVYAVAATDAEGNGLEMERANAHQWNVSHSGGPITFSYTLFADRCDGTYSQIDTSHAHLNMPATFAWARGLESRSVELELDLPSGWQVSTQLQAGGRAGVFRAPNLAHFLDSPLMASEHAVFTWPLVSAFGEQTVRLAIHHLGSEAEAESFAAWTRQVVAEQVEVFGEAPRFEGGSYVFLADYLPWCSGDGMEHRNSTVLTSSRSLENNLLGLLGTVSHEFFHAWNVERIRPRSLEPFDFEKANMSGELWFGEGFTSYYDRLILKRIDALDLDGFADRLTSRVEAITNSPARRFRGPIEVSHQAPFVDAASWIDPTNRSNNFLSYYVYGAAIGLALDLELRGSFEGKSLDEFMAAAWQVFGASERPYTNEALRDLLGEVTGDLAWAQQFFDRYVFGSELPDYGRLLEQAGFVCRTRRGGAAWLGGVRLEAVDSGLQLASGTLVGSPAYEAGLDRGDVILEVDGEVVAGVGALGHKLSEASPGERWQARVRKRGQDLDVEILLAEDPEVEVVTFERAGRPLAPEQTEFRRAWLGRKSAVLEQK